MALTKTTHSMISGASVNVLDFGAVGDGVWVGSYATGVTDDYAAFKAAHDALPVSGGQIIIPRTETNIWRLSQELNFTKPVRLTGQLPSASANFFNTGTVLVFDADKSGIIVNNYQTLGYTMVAANAATPGGNYSVIENLAVTSAGRTDGLSNGGTGIDVDGIFIRAPGVLLNNVWSWLFKRNGVRILASCGSGGAATDGNANMWRVDTLNCQLNGGDGLLVSGTCANAGVGIRINCSGNRGWGIQDNSFLGNTYIGCHTETNTLGPYKTTDANAQSAFLGCYTETGQSSFVSPTVVIGGLTSSEAAISSDSTAFVLGGGGAYRRPYVYTNNLGAVAIGGSLGQRDSSMSAFTFGTVGENATYDAWKLKFDNTNKAWFLQFANSPFFEPIAFINSTSARSAVGTGPILGGGNNDGYYVGTRGAPVLRGFAAAAPVAGAYVVGDIVYNKAPTAGGTIGWVCTTAGTPGTWKTFGSIAA